MKNFKLATLILIASTFSVTAQAADMNIASPVKTVSHTSSANLIKTRQIRVVKRAVQKPATRQISTHTTRSVLYYNVSKSRTKVIDKKVAHANTPNLFK